MVHFAPSWEGAYFIGMTMFIASGAMLREINLLIAVAGLLIAVFVINVVGAYVAAHNVTVKRLMPDRVAAGETVSPRLTLQPRRRWFVDPALRVTEMWRRIAPLPDRERSQYRLPPVKLSADKECVAGYHFAIRSRGIYRVGRTRVSSRFPFGLFRCTVAVDAVAELIVVPAAVPLPADWLSPSRATGRATARHSPRHGAMEGEFYGMRDWRPGDSRRWIHWRTSARRGEITVKQFERQMEQDLTVLVETRGPHAERALEVAAAILAQRRRLDRGRLAFAATTDPDQLVAATIHGKGFLRLLRWLAALPLTEKDGMPELLMRTLKRRPQRGAILVLAAGEIHLDDEERFPGLSRDPDFATRRRRIRVVNVVSLGLHEGGSRRSDSAVE